MPFCCVSAQLTVLQAQTAAADPSPGAQQETETLRQLLADVRQQLQQAQEERESLSERAQVSDMDRRELQAALDETREQAQRDVDELTQVCQQEACLLLHVASATLQHCTNRLCIQARHGQQHEATTSGTTMRQTQEGALRRAGAADPHAQRCCAVTCCSPDSAARRRSAWRPPPSAVKQCSQGAVMWCRHGMATWLSWRS